MKLLYLDCGMGAAGDMLTAALLELFPNRQQTLNELNSLGIPGVEFIAEESIKCGIRGTHIRVLVSGEEEEDHHHHHHSGMEDITHIIHHLRISEQVRRDVLAVYDAIAQAESHVHGVPVTQIHFHEVGTMDAVADVTAVCYLMDKLGADEVHASPVHVGSGQVHCAHGILPVPAPATAHLLRGVPAYSGEIRGELCTPTGAALLKHFVNRFDGMPVMTTNVIGYGMGKKDFPAANCVRAILGSDIEQTDTVAELCCNLDDMTGEAIGFATERLLEAGALDVFITAVHMKKNRPGVKLCCICRPLEREKFARLMLRHTTTLGVRMQAMERMVLARGREIKQTPYGPVEVKTAAGPGVAKRKAEYESAARAARANDVTLEEVLREL